MSFLETGLIWTLDDSSWICTGAGTHATEGGRSEGASTQCERDFLGLFSAWAFFSNIQFFSEGGLGSSVSSRTTESSLVSVSLCLQELLLPVSPTRVVQAHHSRPVWSERFEKRSTSSFCATRKHLLVLMIVVLAGLMHPRFLNMTRDYLTATFAVARYYQIDSGLIQAFTTTWVHSSW